MISFTLKANGSPWNELKGEKCIKERDDKLILYFLFLLFFMLHCVRTWECVSLGFSVTQV